jgi:peptide/nickel transport system permease protein
MAREVAASLEFNDQMAPRRPLARRFAALAWQHPLGFVGALIVLLLFFVAVFAQFSVLGLNLSVAPYDPLGINRAGIVVGRLAEPIGVEDTQVLLDDTSELGVGGAFTLGDEQLYVVMIDDNIVTVGGRSAAKNIAVPHDAGAELIVGDAVVDTGPTPSHPFGTDRLGRDVLSRTIMGARISLLVGLVAVAFGIAVGTPLGVVSGYFGRTIDSVIQRLVDILLAFPALVLLLAIIAVFADDSSAIRGFLSDYTPVPENEFLGVPEFLEVFVISLGIGVAIAVGTVRVVRGAVLSIKENVYIEAARALGASDVRIMVRHIFPNVAALVVILGSVFLPIAILAEAAISFLGVGVQLPTPSWGADLTGPNRESALEGDWWPVLFPGLALSLVVLGFNMLGDAFRDIADPRLRGGQGAGGGGRTGGGGSAL